MKRMEPKKRITSTGILLIVILLGMWLILRMTINPGGSGSGEFNSYRGPILPMSSLSNCEGVEVTRNVNFDFSPYLSSKNYSTLSKGAAGITDTYILTNITGKTQILDLVYGFQGQFIDHPEEFPTISVEGTIVEPELYPSLDPEDLIWNANHFQRYSKVLQENDFLLTALAQAEVLNLPVTAYHFRDLSYQGSEIAGFPMLTVEFSLNENTLIWNYGRAASQIMVDGRHQMMFPVANEEAWIFAVGGTLLDTEYGGNKDYNITETSNIDGVTFHLDVYDTTWMEAIRKLAENYDFWSMEGNETYPNAGKLSTELLITGTLKRIQAGDYRIIEEKIIDIDAIFYDVTTDPSIMYLMFPVEVKEGQSIKVEASYIQEPSLDISGPKKYREGYDLATKLGSVLNFQMLTSSLTHTEHIELGKQNFGFDLDQGIDRVILDIHVDHYYLEVNIKNK